MRTRTDARLIVRVVIGTMSMLLLGWPAYPAGSSSSSVSATSFGWKTTTLPPAVGGHVASFGEPSIAKGPHGTLAVTAARANVGYPTWWFSRDNGPHWGRGEDLDTSGALTGDADAAFGSDGSLFVLNLAFQNPPTQPTNPTILVYATLGDSRDWQGPATFPPPHGADQPDRPWLAPDPNRPDRVYVANSEGAGNVVIWTSTDHARSFSGPTLVTGPDHGANIELTSRPLFDPGDRDRIFMFYEASSPAETALPATHAPLRDFPLTQLWLAESDDAGRSWTNRLVLDITADFGPSAKGGSIGHVLPASAIDDSGTLYTAFSLRLSDSAETHIYLVHSSDRGVHWSRPVRVDSGALRSNVMPALAVGPTGGVDLSWYGSTSADFTDPQSEWAEEFSQTSNGLSAQPTFTQSRVSEGGPVHVGSVDSSGNPGSSQYNWDLRDFQSITIDDCGMARIVWTNDVGPGATVTAMQTAGPSLAPRGCGPGLASGTGPAPQSHRHPKVEAEKRTRSLPATGVAPIWGGWFLLAAAAISAARLLAPNGQPDEGGGGFPSPSVLSREATRPRR